MRKTRRMFLIIGGLFLIGGILSLNRQYQTDYRTLMFITSDRWFQVHVYACPERLQPDNRRHFDAGILSLDIDWSPAGWRASLQGCWWVWAVIAGVPSLVCEVLAYRRKRDVAGFPVEATKNPAHTDGVSHVSP